MMMMTMRDLGGRESDINHSGHLLSETHPPHISGFTHEHDNDDCHEGRYDEESSSYLSSRLSSLS